MTTTAPPSTGHDETGPHTRLWPGAPLVTVVAMICAAVIGIAVFTSWDPDVPAPSASPIPSGPVPATTSPTPPEAEASTGPPPTGVVLTLDQVLSERLAAGEVDEVVSTMHEPIQAAAVACGTSVTEVGAAAGGLLVRLDDPSRSSCVIERLSTAPHVEAAEEDLTVRPQG